tara:strand:+ start:258 stop:515 length:258 start_codon:yes stop_codon:yes gene_type:complete
MGNWKEMLIEEFRDNGDNFEEMKTTLTDEELVREFDDGYGGSEGDHFTSWGEKYVYFPVVYDGAEWVGSAPRNVCDIITAHLGGQ